MQAAVAGVVKVLLYKKAFNSIYKKGQHLLTFLF